MITPPPGTVVRVGRGRTLWRVDSYWRPPTGRVLASLVALEGYAATSVEVHRLVPAEAPR